MKKPLFLALALCMAIAMVTPALAVQSQEVSQGTYDIVVYTNGAKIVAEDSNGRVISSGTAGIDDSTVIQSAAKAISNGIVLLQSGTYVLTEPAGIRVSNPAPTPTPTLTPTPTPVPSGKPDLVVTDISWEPANPMTGDHDEGRDQEPGHWCDACGYDSWRCFHGRWESWFRGLV